jgi:hypothetical protein
MTSNPAFSRVTRPERRSVIGPVADVAYDAVAGADPSELLALLGGKLRLAILDRYHEAAEARRRVESGIADGADLAAAADDLARWSERIAEVLSHGGDAAD